MRDVQLGGLMFEDRVHAVFEARRQSPYEPMLAGVTGSYRFDVEHVGSFVVSVEDGQLEISESSRDADCVIRCEPEVFLDLASGRQNLLTAAMQGLIEIRGDLALAQKLHGLLPSAPAPARSEARPGERP